MDQHLDRMQRRVDELTRKADDLASMAADLHQVVGEMRKDTKQLPLPGLATDGDGEPLAGVSALERRIAELEAENRQLTSELTIWRGRARELENLAVFAQESKATYAAAVHAALRHLGDLTVADTTRMRRAQRALREAIGEPMAAERAAD